MEGRDNRRDGGTGPHAADAYAETQRGAKANAHQGAHADTQPGANADAHPGPKADADAERLLAEQLEDGPIDEPDREERVRAILPPKYEVRIRMEYDPIVEETKRYRGMAREIDGRYDRFMVRMDEEGNGQEGER